MEKTYHWYKIADDENGIPFGENGMAVMEVNGRLITVARHAEMLYAFAHKCPHASGIMSEGWLDVKGNVVCPVHQYRFNIGNGRNSSGEGYRLKCWPIEQRAAGIFVGMEDGGVFDLLLGR